MKLIGEGGQEDLNGCRCYYLKEGNQFRQQAVSDSWTLPLCRANDGRLWDEPQPPCSINPVTTDDLRRAVMELVEAMNQQNIRPKLAQEVWRVLEGLVKEER